MKPFAFGDDVLDKIYRDNFTRILGEKPRPLDFELIAHRCQKCIETESLTELDTENMQKVIQFFKER